VTPDRKIRTGSAHNSAATVLSSITPSCLFPETDAEEQKLPAVATGRNAPVEAASPPGPRLLASNEPNDEKPKKEGLEIGYQDHAAAKSAEEEEEQLLLDALAAADNEVFTFGQHKGEKFCDIAKNDPGYHVSMYLTWSC
jgi:hypothetical protein